jgi:hypothetical protein
MVTNYLVRHFEITDPSIAPCDDYLLIYWGIDGFFEAWELSPDAPLDLDMLMNEALSVHDLEVEVTGNHGGSNTCYIKTNGDAPDDIKCWTMGDFFVEATGEIE